MPNTLLPQYQLDHQGLAGIPDREELNNTKDSGTLALHSEGLFDHAGGDTYDNILNMATGLPFDTTSGPETEELAIVEPRHRGWDDVLPPLKDPQDKLSRMATEFLRQHS